MKLSIYTSCSINYLPKARVLAESIRLNSPGTRLTLCLNDVVPGWLDLAREPFAEIWQPKDLGYDSGWIFQHNVMELCTAVKGRALLRLMDTDDDADLYLYLDPDVFVFNDLSIIDDYMDSDSIGLVPHILSPEETQIGIQLTEMSVTEHGIYNLGHLFIRPDANGRDFAAWWAERLDSFCFDDRERGLFTDQRWVDLVPAIFDGVRILKMPNLNVASWNLFGREIQQRRTGDATSFFVNDRWPLVTYHFSGTGPTGTHRRIREIFDAGNGASAEIERLYETALACNGQDELANLASGFDIFDDGTSITSEARKMYRRHADLQTTFKNPYDCAEQPNYRDWLRRNKTGIINGIRISQVRVPDAFDDLFDESYYLDTYPEVTGEIAAGRYSSACDHYVQIGSRLFLDPNEFFVSSFYHDGARYHDPHLLRLHAGKIEGTLLWHYLTVGLSNGIEPIEFFDSVWYLQKNTDLMNAFRLGMITSPLAHLLHYGGPEDRAPGPNFDGDRYLEKTPRARKLCQNESALGAFGAFVRLGGVTGRVNV